MHHGIRIGRDCEQQSFIFTTLKPLAGEIQHEATGNSFLMSYITTYLILYMSNNGLSCFTCACIISDLSDTAGVTESTATGMAPRTLFSKPAPASTAAVSQTAAAAAGFSKPVQAMPTTTTNSTAGASSATPNLFGSLAFNKPAPTTAPTGTAFAGLSECYVFLHTE